MRRPCRHASASVRVIGDRSHLVGRVGGAELARLRDVHDERLRPVFVVPPHASLAMRSGVSVPSGVLIVSSLMPPVFSGAPPSSV